MVGNAQDPQEAETVDHTLGYGTDVSYAYLTGAAGDTIGIADSIWTYKVRVKSKFALKPELIIRLDSTGGTSNSVGVNLYSKTFAYEDYTLRETVTWATGVDTTIVLRSDSTHVSEFWKIGLLGANDTFKAKILDLVLKISEDR